MTRSQINLLVFRDEAYIAESAVYDLSYCVSMRVAMRGEVADVAIYCGESYDDLKLREKHRMRDSDSMLLNIEDMPRFVRFEVERSDPAMATYAYVISQSKIIKNEREYGIPCDLP